MPSTTPHSTAAPEHTLRATTVVDEAFADLPDLTIRIDEGQSAVAPGNFAAETERLVSNISRQLEAIERQRHRLARLLRGLDVSDKQEIPGKPA